MTLIIRQLRAVFTETPLSLRTKKQQQPTTTEKQQRRKSLTVKISKEPPCIVYYERHDLEDSFECIFDPQVSHDEEKDHPDLFIIKNQQELKPWQKEPYCSTTTSRTTNHHKSTFMTKFKATFQNNNTTIKTNL